MKRSTRRVILVALCAAAIGVGIGVGVAVAHDIQLDDANATLVKAKALLNSATPTNADPKAQQRFGKAVDKAITDIQNAQDQIVKAANADDGS